MVLKIGLEGSKRSKPFVGGVFAIGLGVALIPELGGREGLRLAEVGHVCVGAGARKGWWCKNDAPAPAILRRCD